MLAATPPNVTAEAFVKFVPVIVTAVFPDVPPDVGVTVVIVGAATVVTEMVLDPESEGEGAGVLLSGAPPNSTMYF